MKTVMPKQENSDPVKILLVDDLKDNLLALEALLRRDDVQIFEAKSGTEALDFMITHDFALALIDVQMPGMSGFELAEFMRGAKKTKHIPIIFVTATATDQSFSFKGYQSGAVDFLRKPLDSFAVKSKVSIFIDMFRQKNEIKTQFETITGLLKSLKDAKNEADRANSSKTQFLANMSHEIRTPLSAILGYSELMTDPEQTVADALYCGKGIRRNIEHLTELIDEILDISKVEAGKLEVDRVRFDLIPVMDEIFMSLHDRAKVRGLKLDVKCEGKMPKTVISCPMRLRQILLNIVGNALKFTAQGGVEIDVRLISDQRRPLNHLLQFEVKDTGCGLSPEQQERLFLPFSQADSSVTRKYGGTGLGLMLARSLAEALGGSVILTKSHIGEGSTFTFNLDPGPLTDVPMIDVVGIAQPKKQEETVKDPVVAPRKLTDISLLLVEDAPDNQILLRRFLEADGATVATAINGEEGLKMALAGTYDLVLMDMQMPILDGYEATKKLREMGYTTPIIALTANAMRGEREICLGVGCVEYLSKPVKAHALVEIVAKFTKNISKSSSTAIL